MNTRSARILLTSTLFALLSATFLTGHTAGSRDKTFSPIDPFTSGAALVGNEAKKSEGHDHQVPGAGPPFATAPFRTPAAFPLTAPPALRHIFPETQARAPPLS
ncbi:MAG: hypothetical protein V2I26_18980 [Halieaceae bacterium]|nr:hypothetical protein [Halieaceae bacterium]